MGGPSTSGKWLINGIFVYMHVCVPILLLEESGLWWMEDSSSPETKGNSSQAAVTSEVSVPLAGRSLFRSPPGSLATEDVGMETCDHSTDLTTDQCDVDKELSRPSSVGSAADYSVAAKNVADGYQKCRSGVTPFAAFRPDRTPAKLVMNSENSRQNSERSVGCKRNRDQAETSLLPLQNDDDDSSADEQYTRQSLLKSSDFPSLYTTSAASEPSGDVSGNSSTDFSGYTSQLHAIDLTANDTSPCTEYSGSKLRDSPPLSDTGYARAAEFTGRYPAEFYTSAAPLSPEYDVCEPNSVS